MRSASSRPRRPQRFVGAASFAGAHRRAGPRPTSSSATRPGARSPTSARPTHDPLSHLELVANADVFLIAPASANTIAKLAHGLADNLLTERGARRDAARCSSRRR